MDMAVPVLRQGSLLVARPFPSPMYCCEVVIFSGLTYFFIQVVHCVFTVYQLNELGGSMRDNCLYKQRSLGCAS